MWFAPNIFPFPLIVQIQLRLKFVLFFRFIRQHVLWKLWRRRRWPVLPKPRLPKQNQFKTKVRWNISVFRGFTFQYFFSYFRKMHLWVTRSCALIYSNKNILFKNWNEEQHSMKILKLTFVYHLVLLNHLNLLQEYWMKGKIIHIEVHLPCMAR